MFVNPFSILRQAYVNDPFVLYEVINIIKYFYKKIRNTFAEIVVVHITVFYACLIRKLSLW